MEPAQCRSDHGPLPTLLVYLFLGCYFIRGLLAGSVMRGLLTDPISLAGVRWQESYSTTKVADCSNWSSTHR